MTTKSLTITEMYTIAGSLRVAAEQYLRDEKTLRGLAGGTGVPLADQYHRQAGEAIELAELFEQADEAIVKWVK